MNKMVLSLAALVAGSALGAALRSPDGYSVSVPAGWVQATQADARQAGTSAVFYAPKSLPNFRPNVNVVVQRLPAGFTQRAYHALSLKQLGTLITDSRVLSQRATTLGGQPANEVVYEGRQGTLTLHWHAVYAVRGTRAYVVTGTTIKGAEAAVVPAMKTVMGSFKFLP